MSRRRFYEEQYRCADYASGLEGRSEAEALRAFVESYGLAGGRVLEIGCGRGAFQDIVEDWVGVDLASSVAPYIRKPFVCASAGSLPFRDASFDAIWSITTLEHVPHPERALHEIFRVLKPGGVAYLAPAWHCRTWAAEGYEVRPWSGFGWKGKLIKASIPLRNALWFRAAHTLPKRLWREVFFVIGGRKPTCFRYRKLEANYGTYWCTDSDACNSMDAHEVLLWFRSRGWHTPSHPGCRDRVLVRHEPIVVQKPHLTAQPSEATRIPGPRRAIRLAILTSHPIQYQAPLHRALAAHPDIDLTVLFCSDAGVKPYQDQGFGQEVRWDVPLLDGYRSEFLPNWSPAPGLTRFNGLINPGVVRRLRTGRFDAVMVHGWARVTNCLAIITAFASGIPVLLRGETNFLRSLPAWKAAVKRAVLSTLFRRVSGFLAIGRYNAEFYLAYGVPPERVFHVPYAVDNEFFLSKADELAPRKAELKVALGIPADCPVVLFSGKLIGVKRPIDLLKAFEIVSKKNDAALVYVGDGELRPALEQYARANRVERVFFPGFQNQSELPRYFAEADIFVLPSDSEPWGLVVNEAMCFSMPVIASNQVGAAGDLVREGINGFVYPVGNVDELIRRLERLVGNAALRRRMGEASRRAIETWSYKEDVNGVLRCLRALLDRGRS